MWGNINTTVTSTTAPDGTATASLITATATAVTMVNQPVTGAGSASGNTFSVFVKKGSAATIGNNFILRNDTTSTNLLSVNLNYDTGVITYSTGSSGASVVALANGWWRIILTATSGISAGNQLRGYIGFSGASATAGDSMRWWGAQLEAGPFATSYIPTTTAAATRAADLFTIAGTYAPTCSIGIDFKRPANTPNGINGRLISFTEDPFVSTYSQVFLASTTDEVKVSKLIGGVPSTELVVGTALDGASGRVYVAFSSTSYRASSSGAAVAAVDGLSPSTSKPLLNIGSLVGSNSINAYLQKVVLLPFAMSDSQLQLVSAL